MDKTIDYYNLFASDFVSKTINADVDNLHELFLKYMPNGSKILDLGCGSGRDSKIFKKKGYQVVAIDGSEECCKLAEKHIEQEVLCKTFEQIDYQNEFDGIWACASLLHIPSSDIISIFEKISIALKPLAYLYCSFKYGDFEGERNGRYFLDLNPNKLTELLKPLKELIIIETSITSDVRDFRANEKWLNVIIKKSII